MPLPDFVGIGAQKAGTSWLRHHLAQQERVWMTPLKELHWFDHVTPTWWSGLRGDTYSERRARSLAARACRRPWRREDREVLAWSLRYLALPRTVGTYQRLFRDDPTLVQGEVTPAYARLGDDVIAELVTARPDLRVLYLVRDPIEVAWSRLKMRAEKQLGGADPASPAAVTALRAILRVLTSDCDFASVVERWARHLEPGALHVAFFDDIQVDPAGVVRSACRHVGLRDDEIAVASDVGSARNARPGGPPPAAVLDVVVPSMLPVIERQHRHFANAHTQRWLDRARAMAS